MTRLSGKTAVITGGAKGSVSDLADLDRLYAGVKTERGTLDIVFANAGAGGPLPLGKLTVEHIDETFDHPDRIGRQ